MKKFWRITKKILVIASVAGCLTLFVITLTSAIQAQQELHCKSIVVQIDFETGLSFINEKEIEDRINYLSGESIIGRKITAIDFKTLENEIEKNPYVSNAEIFVDGSQSVHVSIQQKRPILRVLNNDGVGYYISEDCERLPLHPTFTPHLAVAVGNVETGLVHRDSVVQAHLFSLINEIRKDDFLNSYIDQIDVLANEKMDLLPKGSLHTIKLGRVDNQISDKLSKLKVFYKEGLNKLGWDKYRTINLKYSNQVVCEKRETTVTTDSVSSN
ncbi:MAG: hypothetical protein IPN22_05645 [Bacteroidetes bacterium]|nr:hypothetical protein [Bacteroidota bacterium]